MSPSRNSRKTNFLASLPAVSLDSETCDITSRSKFNFSYFTVQAAGQNFCDWSGNDLAQMLTKLHEYTKFPLSHWKRQRAGNHAILEIYEEGFPKKSEFTHPKHVPSQAMWGRFRLEQAVRLVGFVLPDDYHDKAHARTGVRFDCNCFYVVFLDAEHKFYLTEKK